MKRICFLILAMVLILAMATMVSAEQAPASGQFSDTVNWSFADGVLTLSGTGPVDNPVFTENPWYAFKYDVHKVVVQEGITVIGYCCFAGFSNLTEVQLPDSLEVIGQQAFSLTGIKELTIPKNVHTIGESHDPSASVGLQNDLLENIFVDDANPHYYDIDGILYCRDHATLVCCPSGKQLGAFAVPAGIKHIGTSAFGKNHSLTALQLPQGLLTIGNSSFYATDLEEVTIPGTVTTVGPSAFMTCKKLRSVTVSAGVTAVKSRAFAFCDQLETVTVLNASCQLAEESELFPGTALLVGYENSTLHKYALQFGCRFRNLETGVTTNYYREGGLAAFLPTDLTASNAVECIVSSHSTATGERNGYQPHAFIPDDPAHPVYQDIYNTTLEITKSCSTDRQKVEAVMNWLHSNITYAFGVGGGSFTPENVYSTWSASPRVGNCMVYSKFTGLMLRILGIPTATASNATHEWILALVDGKWLRVDTTNGWVADTGYEDDTSKIFFCVGDVGCVIDDFSGIKVASYGTWTDDTKTTNDIYIPSYVSHIYRTTFSMRKYAPGQPKVTLRGEKGSYAESYVKNQLPSYEITYEGNKFVARERAHIHTPGSYLTDVSEHWQVCSGCQATLNRGAHLWGSNNTCTVCDRQKPPVATTPTVPATSTAPVTTHPATTVPATTVPETTVPETIVPPATVPVTTPAPTVPPTTGAASAPAGTVQPSQTAPMASTPAPTVPQGSAEDGPSAVVWVVIAVAAAGGAAAAAWILLKKRHKA